MRSIVVAVLLLSNAMALHAQQWVELMLDEQSNVQVVKEAFDAAWEGRPYVRGNGWKQFQRWHWFMDQRTWPSGERMDPAIHMQALEEVRAMENSGTGQRDNAVWEPLGPTAWSSTSYNPGNGRVNTVLVDPRDPNTIYVGTPASGLWRSTDHGSTWQALFTDLASMGVSGIVVDTTGTGIIYIATGDGDGTNTYSVGVLKSTDDGATWNTTGLNWNTTQTRTTRALRMDPDSTQRMYCAASNGLYRTINGAQNWQQVMNGSFRDVEFMPGDPTQVYACTDRFFRSVSAGGSFTASGISGLPPTDSVGRMAIAVSPADPMMVYVLCSREDDNSFLGLYRSIDAGLNFELRSSTPNIFCYAAAGDESGGQSWYDMALAVDPVNPDVVYVGGVNVWRSGNGGYDWEISSHWVFPSNIGYTHADIHSLDLYNGVLYCGSDGGIHISTDAGDTWEDKSAGLDIMQFYRMGSSELLPQLIIAGAQDNGCNRFLDGPWTHVQGADGMESAVDPFDPNTLYCSSQNGGLKRSDNGGVDWTSLVDDMTEDGPWVTSFALDPTTPGRMLAGFNNLFVSWDYGTFWSPVTTWDTDQFVRCLAFAPSNGDVWYVARNDQVQRLDDAGWTFVDIRLGLPSQTPTSFAVSPEDPMHVWISFSGTSPGQKVYESTNGGLDWTNRSAGLPNTPVNSVVVQPDSPNGLYVGTDLGVFYRDDYTGTWAPYGTGMPKVVVNELEINNTTGKLRAATFGRGIWQADLFYSPFAGVPQHGANAGPRLIPIDTDGRYMVQTDNGTGRLSATQVLDPMGRMLSSAKGSGASLIDLSASAAGTYLVQIKTENGTWCRRVVR